MAKGMKDLAGLGYGAYSGIINPGAAFGLVGALMGVSDESRPGAFHDKKFRQYKTERTKHIRDDLWEFDDPTIGAKFQFKQDRQGNYHVLNPRTGEFIFQDPFRGVGWNLHEEQMKIYQGGGTDQDYTAPGGPAREPGKKITDWGTYLSRRGPFHNPITPESLTQARTFRDWQGAQRERNQPRQDSPQPFNMANALQRMQANKGKSYWEATGTPAPPPRASHVPDWLLDFAQQQPIAPPPKQPVAPPPNTMPPPQPQRTIPGKPRP